MLERRQTPIYGDAAGYFLSAAALLHGRVDPASLEALPPLPAASFDAERARQLVATRGPGYVAFLAGIFRVFGVGPWPVRIAQALLGACLCALLCQTGRELAGPAVGLAAGLLAALHPSLILFSGRILSESVAGFELVLGLALLVGGIRRRRAAWLACAGLAFAAAALTRPPLLALLPALPLASAAALAGTGKRGMVLVGVLCAALLAPVAGWSLALRASGTSPIAGTRGLGFVVDVARTATLPELRGWRPDSFPPLLWTERSGEWGPVLAARSLYPAAAAANLVFQHLWFLDDLWREVPGWLHGFQRALALLAIAGLGLAGLQWRHFAPLFGALAPAALVFVSWIEPRHTLPFVPLLILLASLFGASLVGWCRPRPGRAALVLAALLGSAAVGFATRLPRLAALLPGVDPLALGAAADASVITLAFAWGALVWRLAAPSLGARRAALAGFGPASFFALLFAASACVGSEPRWRAWRVDLAGTLEAVQTLELTAPLAADEIHSALWLVDLETRLDPPPLRVALDGHRLEPASYAWQRLFCQPEAPRLPGLAPEARRPRRPLPLSDAELSQIWCRVYQDGIDRFTGALAGSPQWWGLRMDPGRLSGRRVLSLGLAADGAPLAPVRIGGAYARGPGPFVGPSLAGLTPGPGTSLTRWHVVHDWRFWETTPLASLTSAGRFAGPAASPALADALARGEAQLGIRLLIGRADGRWEIY